MATVIQTSYVNIGDLQVSGERSLYYYVYANYSAGSNGNRTIKFIVRPYNTADTSAYIHHLQFHLTYNNTEYVTEDDLRLEFPSGGFGSDSIYYIEIPVNYNQTNNGQWKNKSITFWMGGSNSHGEWYDGEQTAIATGVSAGSVSTTISLPDIDPKPTLSVGEIVIQKPYTTQYNDIFIVAGRSKLKIPLTYENARSINIVVSGAGVTQSYSIDLSNKISSSTKTKTTDVVPTSSSNYDLKIKITVANNTSSVVQNITRQVKGYALPTTGSKTYAVRCNASREPDPQGMYGKLYLTWVVKKVDDRTSGNVDPNTLQSYKVYLNGNLIQPWYVSQQTGYPTYFFGLDLNTQGNLKIVLADKITQNTITDFVVAKETMPLSLYQGSENDVGVAIGRMATKAGFICYEDFILKSSTAGSSKMYQISVDDNGTLSVTLRSDI